MKVILDGGPIYHSSRIAQGMVICGCRGAVASGRQTHVAGPVSFSLSLSLTSAADCYGSETKAVDGESPLGG